MSIKVLNADSTAKYLESIQTGAVTDPFIPVYSDIGLAVAAGNVLKISAVNKFGRNGDVDTGSVPEDMISTGGLIVHPTTARTHDIVSASASDTSAGTGARTVLISGLDASYALQNETVTMNGTTNVPTANTYTRVFRMEVITAGSNETNVGNITATAQTDATVSSQIDADEGQTLQAEYTVPADHILLIRQVYVDTNRPVGTTGGTSRVQLKYRKNIDASNPAVTTKHVIKLSVEGSSIAPRKFDPPLVVPEKTDVWLRVVEVSDNNTALSGGFDGYLIDQS